MANNATYSMTFKIEDAGNGFQKLSVDAEAFKKILNQTVVEAEKLKKKIFNFAALSTSLENINKAFFNIHSSLSGFSDAYAVQETAERKLETVMRQRMGATDEEIQSIKDLASAQQEIGILGDEVQLSGAQQVATYLQEKSSIDTLLPAMNNLLAQQKGLNASTTDAESIANLFGKAMQGQTSALKRVGISF